MGCRAGSRNTVARLRRTTTDKADRHRFQENSWLIDEVDFSLPEAPASTESSCLLPLPDAPAAAGRMESIMSDGKRHRTTTTWRTARPPSSSSRSKINVSARGIRYPPTSSSALLPRRQLAERAQIQCGQSGEFDWSSVNCLSPRFFLSKRLATPSFCLLAQRLKMLVPSIRVYIACKLVNYSDCIHGQNYCRYQVYWILSHKPHICNLEVRSHTPCWFN